MQQVAALPTAPSELRAMMRRGELSGLTSGMAPGRVQANLVILPREQAFDFLLFCQRNPKPCPLLEVVEVGSSEPPNNGARGRSQDRPAQVPRLRVRRARRGAHGHLACLAGRHGLVPAGVQLHVRVRACECGDPHPPLRDGQQHCHVRHVESRPRPLAYSPGRWSSR